MRLRLGLLWALPLPLTSTPTAPQPNPNQGHAPKALDRVPRLIERLRVAQGVLSSATP